LITTTRSASTITSDEPAAGLGDTATAEPARLLRAIRRTGATIVVVEQNVRSRQRGAAIRARTISNSFYDQLP